MSVQIQNLDKLEALIGPMLRAARIPGAAIAIVAGGKTVFAEGYGYRDLQAKLPMTPDTAYPIASTTKAINATLIGMLVDEGKLAWDAPVQEYLPGFRLWDACVSTQVTLRDLLAMRTGLPRHDWMWIENPMSRAELVERVRHLEPSAGFREKFQYNNLTSTTAGHVAEVVTGECWEDLVRRRILQPLGMNDTGFVLPTSGPASLSYCETRRRELQLTRRLGGEVTAPSGGSIHSTVEDMAQWMAFNLGGGKVDGHPLIQPHTLTEIQSPQMAARTDPSCPTPNAAYAMGWFVDVYNGENRVAHGGYLHDVNSEVMLFPAEDLGIVSFTNFGFPALARLICEHAFDLIRGGTPVRTLDQSLTQYETKIEENRKRIASVRRVENTSPSHSLSDYSGAYLHPGYGRIDIVQQDERLTFRRNSLVVPLRHWHYDAWVPLGNEGFYFHVSHPFDTASRFLFETDADGAIAAVSVRLEPSAAPIRFEKQ